MRVCLTIGQYMNKKKIIIKNSSERTRAKDQKTERISNERKCTEQQIRRTHTGNKMFNLPLASS